MTDDKPEVIPPQKNLPARQEQESNLPASTRISTSVMTGLQASLRARTAGKIAEAVRAESDVYNALTERHGAQGRLLRAAEELAETPETIALDKARRRTERAEEYAKLAARYDNIGEDRTERSHQSTIASRRREREKIEAEHSVYNTQRKFDYRKLLKELEEKLWAARKEEKVLNVQATIAEVRAVLDEHAEVSKTGPAPDAAALLDAAEALKQQKIARGENPEVVLALIAGIMELAKKK